MQDTFALYTCFQPELEANSGQARDDRVYCMHACTMEGILIVLDLPEYFVQILCRAHECYFECLYTRYLIVARGLAAA